MLVNLMFSLLLLIIAYLLGSIPTGYLAGYYLQGIDIREHGSGGTGATNVLRSLGKKPAIAVLIIDLLKGAIAAAQVKAFYAVFPGEIPALWQAGLVTGAALASVLGHSKSIWIGFAGGKSVATSLGALFVMNPWVGLGTLVSFLLMMVFSRIVSLSSLTGAIAVNILMLVFHQPIPYILFAAVAGIYVIVRHKTNIERLLAGTEPKIGQKLQQESEA